MRWPEHITDKDGDRIAYAYDDEFTAMIKKHFSMRWIKSTGKRAWGGGWDLEPRASCPFPHFRAWHKHACAEFASLNGTAYDTLKRRASECPLPVLRIAKDGTGICAPEYLAALRVGIAKDSGAEAAIEKAMRDGLHKRDFAVAITQHWGDRGMIPAVEIRMYDPRLVDDLFAELGHVLEAQVRHKADETLAASGRTTAAALLREIEAAWSWGTPDLWYPEGRRTIQWIEQGSDGAWQMTVMPLDAYDAFREAIVGMSDAEIEATRDPVRPARVAGIARQAGIPVAAGEIKAVQAELKQLRGEK